MSHASEFEAKGYEQLAIYNAERSRGIVHTPEYDEAMAVIQERFDREHSVYVPLSQPSHLFHSVT